MQVHRQKQEKAGIADYRSSIENPVGNEYFVKPGSVVRTIWGKSDTVLLIFAGASAEFALHKAVDWLYFTGRLPSDPIGRLFSTVSYAQSIVFSNKNIALKTIEMMTKAHHAVEKKRGMAIPNWAYKDVLFMLIDYSIRSFEALERKMSLAEKQEVFSVFYRLGIRMQLKDLPLTFADWQKQRQLSLTNHLQPGPYSAHLFSQYKKHLGPVYYQVLLLAQSLVIPKQVRQLMGFKVASLFSPLVTLYKWSSYFKADRLLKTLLLPSRYKSDIEKLDTLGRYTGRKARNRTRSRIGSRTPAAP